MTNETRMLFVECTNSECSFHLHESSFINISERLHHLFHFRGVQRSVARPFIQNVIWFWQAASLHVHILDEGESLGQKCVFLSDLDSSFGIQARNLRT